MTSQIQNAFETFSDQLLLKVLSADTSSLDLYGSALVETIDRGLLGEDEFESLFKRFVHLGLNSLWSRYLELDELGWEDSPEEALAEFLRHVQSWNVLRPESIDWPWPITEIPEGKSGKGVLEFDHRNSGLWLCGYRVGKTRGMPTAERREFLDTFFRNELPAVVERHHGNDYGDPGSEMRLRKMANVIATNCRNAKRRNSDSYRYAIADWETDLRYLKDSYYIAGSFPWPSI